MKTVLILVLVLTLTERSLSQEKWNTPKASDFPQVKEESATPEGFVPAKWKVVARSDGDLNGDMLTDLVLVIRGTLSKFLYRDSVGLDPFDTNPNILLILFRTSKARYRLAEYSKTFIIPRDNPSMAEPFESVSIRNKVLILKFEEWYSAGTWYTAERTYRFEYLGGQFKLIGADKTESMRNSGEVESRSYNFLTKQLKTTISSYDKRVKPRSTWKRFDIGKLKTFQTFPKPFGWEIEPDYLL